MRNVCFTEHKTNYWVFFVSVIVRSRYKSSLRVDLSQEIFCSSLSIFHKKKTAVICCSTFKTLPWRGSSYLVKYLHLYLVIVAFHGRTLSVRDTACTASLAGVHATKVHQLLGSPSSNLTQTLGRTYCTATDCFRLPSRGTIKTVQEFCCRNRRSNTEYGERETKDSTLPAPCEVVVVPDDCGKSSIHFGVHDSGPTHHIRGLVYHSWDNHLHRRLSSVHWNLCVL